MRSPKEVFSKQHNTHSRSQLQDYDYLDQLSETEKEWLSRFTENYYSASFDKKPAFAKTKELIELLSKQVHKGQKWIDHLTRVKSHTKKFYQVSKNEKKILNIDLRILASIDLFYQKPDGGYSTSKYYKYSENNVIDPTNDSVRKTCNDRSNHQSGCVMGKFGANNIDDMEIIDKTYSICGPEDYLLRIEEEMIEESII